MGALWPEDYEKVFGKPTKWSLFSEDEEAYEALRQTIIDAPNYVYDKKKLPFTGVKVYGYDLYLLKLYSDKKKAEGKKLFYIKDETPGLAKVLAFGYFDYRKESFYLMANSLIRKTDFQEKMKRHPALNLSVTKLKVQSENRKCDAEGQAMQLELFRPEGYRIKQDVACSASIAAAYALGQEADFTKWKGMNGKSLAETYTFYQDISRLSEIKSIWESIRKLKEKTTPIFDDVDDNHLLADKIIIPLLRHKEKEANTPTAPTKVPKFEAPKEKTVAKKAKASTQKKSVDTPVEAPTSRPQKSTVLSVIRCYLVDLLTGKYKATGLYYVQEKTIKVLAGAVFSTDVSSTLRYSLADYQRRTFIKEQCSTKKSIYTLKEDYWFDSVDTAALYVMGQIVDGLSVWITVEGKSLRELVE